MRERAIRRRDIATCATLVVAFYHTHLDPNRMPSGGDFANLFWPGRLLAQQSWAQGVVPLWNPWNFLGTPFAATMQQGVFYPVDWLIFTTQAAHHGLSLYLLVHLVFAALGALYFLTRVSPLRGFPAAVLGAAWPCTAWFWGHQEHINQIACGSWAPWMMGIAIEFARGARTTRSFAASYGLCSAMQFLAGHPQAAVFTHLATLGVLATVPREGAAPGSAARRRLRGLALAGLLGGLLAGMQLLPAMEMSRHSVRQLDDPFYARFYSVPVDAAILLVAPHAFGSFRDGFRKVGPGLDEPDLRAYNEYGMFAGIPILGLAVVGAAAAGERRRTRRILAGGALLCLLLSFGGNIRLWPMPPFGFTDNPGPAVSLYDLFLLLVPPANGFRVPARFLMFFLLLVITLAAHGWAMVGRFLLGRSSSRALPALAQGALAAASMLALYLPSLKEKFRHPVPAEPLLELVARERPRTPPSLDNRLYRLWLQDDALAAKSERELATTIYFGNPIALRWERLQPNMNMVLRIPMEDGYEEGLSPTLRTKRFLMRFNRNFRSAHPDAQFLALLGIGHVWFDTDAYDAAFYRTDPGQSTPWRQLSANPLHRGAAFWHEAAHGIDFAKFDAPQLPPGEFGLTRNTEAVAYGTAPNWGRPWPRITTRMPTTNEIDILTESNSPPGDAVVSMGYYPDWYLVSDRWVKEPVQWISAVHALIPRAFVENGDARMAYMPRSYRVGIFLTAVGVAMLMFSLSVRPREPLPWRGQPRP